MQKKRGLNSNGGQGDQIYKWFNKLLAKHNLDFVVTAHPEDDNVRNFFN